MDASKMRYKCYKCGKDYTSSEIRYAGTGGKYACIHCLGIKQKAPTSAQRNDALRDNDDPMVEYACSSCKYAFKRKRSFTVNACPYCSKRGTLEVKTGKAAEKLVRDTMSEDLGIEWK